MEKRKIIFLAEIGILTAVILLMSFTPLGYLRLPALGLEITFLTIPVIIGAITLGPAAGATLGAVFGITSFIQAFGMSPFGALLLQINPVGTFVTTVVPRLLMGLLTALIFKAFREKNILSFAVTSLAGALLNTVLFMTSFMLFFSNADVILEMRGDMNVMVFVAVFVGINGVVEAISCAVLGTGISKVVHKANAGFTAA